MNSARESSNRLAELLSREHHAMGDFLVALADFDRQRAWVELGHASLFSFLTRELRLSTGAAFYRQTAARLLQDYPEVIEPLRDGRLCLTTIVEVSKVVTRGNLEEVLPRFFGASKQEAKEVAAELSPEAVPTRTVLTPVEIAAPAASAPSAPLPVSAQASTSAEPSHANAFRPDETLLRAEPAPRASAVAPVVVEPKTAELSRMHITVSRRLLEKLSAARDALSHSHPNAAEDEIIEAGLDLLLDRTARRRGVVKTPRSAAPTATATATATPTATATSRYIPAAVRRAVWLRDEGRCQWPLASGGVCGSTVRIQLHHKDAWAKHPAPATAEALMCACAFHNDLAARQDFGNAWMDRFTSRPSVTAPA